MKMTSLTWLFKALRCDRNSLEYFFSELLEVPLLVSETSEVLGLLSGSAGLVDFSVEPNVNPVGFALLSVVLEVAGPDPNLNVEEALFDELESEAPNLKPDVVTDANAGFAVDDPKAGVVEALGLEPGLGSEQHTH